MKKKTKPLKKQAVKTGTKQKFKKPILVTKTVDSIVTSPSIVFADYGGGGCK